MEKYDVDLKGYFAPARFVLMNLAARPSLITHLRRTRGSFEGNVNDQTRGSRPNDIQYVPLNRLVFDGDVIEAYKVVFESPKPTF